ncbi:THAP domain-containing protein 2-like isoform X2 [Sardina pilchardus]|uniref:THAP domain-containing protein 2-like isoform X1 n=1 Tax=Sardina pilchardus TaxID=27697 RepID=UPI002E0E4FFB
MSCCAVGCTNGPSQRSSVQFFRFPLGVQHADRLRRWLVNITRQDWEPSKSSHLCSLHFEDHEFTIDTYGNRLTCTAVPTVFSLPDHLVKRPASRKGVFCLPPPSCTTTTIARAEGLRHHRQS